MIRRSRRGGYPPSIGQSLPDEWPDEQLWQRLVAILSAANRSDPDTLAELLNSLDGEVSDDDRAQAGAYLWYILRYRVADILEHRPVTEDLHQIATQFSQKFSKLVREGEHVFEDTLRTVFRMPTIDAPLDAGRLFVFASAAAGVLIEQPSDLEKMHSHILEWYTTGP